MSKTSVSIVMPNYNGEKYLQLALDSFLRERHDAKELIVVDGKSTDGSHCIIAEYAERNASIRWLRVADAGISDAVNRAIEVAKGEIIGYLGSDDLLSGDVFGTIARWAPLIDFDAIYFNSYTYYVKERRCLLQRPSVPEITFESLLANGTIVGLQNTYYRRRVFDELKFNVENRYSMDYELLLEVARRKGMFLHVDQVATLNYFDGNISHNNDAQALEAAYVARRFCGDYEGRLFGEDRLPEAERRRPPEQDAASGEESPAQQASGLSEGASEALAEVPAPTLPGSGAAQPAGTTADEAVQLDASGKSVGRNAGAFSRVMSRLLR